MTYQIDREVWRIIDVYDKCKVPLSKPRAFALRLLEEAVELCLACGASPQDIYAAHADAMRKEHAKDPSRGFVEERIESQAEITGEIADIVLLAAVTAAVASVNDGEVADAAKAKVDRLESAAAAGLLHFTADGRFYRRTQGDSK